MARLSVKAEVIQVLRQVSTSFLRTHLLYSLTPARTHRLYSLTPARTHRDFTHSHPLARTYFTHSHPLVRTYFTHSHPLVGTESSTISSKSGKMVMNLILLQEKLSFSREKRTLLQDELVSVITNRERSHEIFRLLNMFKRIIACGEEEIIVAIERETLPFIGSDQSGSNTSTIDQCISKMLSCTSILRCHLLHYSFTRPSRYPHSLTHSLTHSRIVAARNHNTQRKVDQVVKLLACVLENFREKVKFDAVLNRIDVCRERLNVLILSAQKYSLHVNMVTSLTHSLTCLLTH